MHYGVVLVPELILREVIEAINKPLRGSSGLLVVGGDAGKAEEEGERSVDEKKGDRRGQSGTGGNSDAQVLSVCVCTARIVRAPTHSYSPARCYVTNNCPTYLGYLIAKE